MDKSHVLIDYLENLKYLVLDEADRLFDETILPDIRNVYVIKLNINYFQLIKC